LRAIIVSSSTIKARREEGRWAIWSSFPVRPSFTPTPLVGIGATSPEKISYAIALSQ
jgi:hypothetical protein